MVSKKYGRWLVMLITLILAGWLTVLQLSLPYMGIGVRQVSDKWIVSDIYADSWAASEGIIVGDILIEIDYKSPDSEQLTRNKGITSAKSIHVDRNGTLLHFDFSKSNKQPISLNQLVIPMSLFILLFTFSSFIIYKKPHDRAALLLILFLLSVSIGYLAAGGNTRGDKLAGIVMKLTVTFAPAFLFTSCITILAEQEFMLLTAKRYTFGTPLCQYGG